MKRIMEGKLWELMETVQDIFKKNVVINEVRYCNSIEYSSNKIYFSINKTNRNKWVLLAKSRNVIKKVEKLLR